MYAPSRIPLHSKASKGLIGPDASAYDCEAASPIDYGLTDFPPCLLIHGADDDAVLPEESTNFYEKLRRSDRTAELHLFAGQGHAFDRQSNSQAGMVDVADPSAVYGVVTLEIIRLFFQKQLGDV